ncbi:TPA: prohibitin family protein [Streptococcus suis]|nr:prohibitin family protein [Streptococcus suis]HEL1673702.1 prohibitin family protein [Streptococcus suis]HEL1773227.1 prohibitin family protein [Streptococcus suis]HEL2140232.1 prohibitin family protein [Streptococcus suis]
MYENEFQVTKRQVAAGATIIGLIIFAVFFRLTAVVKIPANTVGVKVSAFNGVQEKTLQTGYHLKVPFADKVYKLPTSVQTKIMEAITTQTKDGQWLNTNIDVKYKVNKAEAMTVFTNYTDLENVSNSVVAPAVQRAIESVTGEYDIYEVLGSKRTEVYGKIDQKLKERFAADNLEFVSFTITDQDSGDEIEKAIKDESVKQKQVDSAKQDQEKVKIEAETKKIQAQADADAEVIKAQGQAKANAELNNSISDNLIRMKEAEARLEHGWVEVITQGDVITNQE